MRVTWFENMGGFINTPSWLVNTSFIIGYFVVLFICAALFFIALAKLIDMLQTTYVKIRAPEIVQISKILYSLGLNKDPEQQAKWLARKYDIDIFNYSGPSYVVVADILQKYSTITGDTYQEQLYILEEKIKTCNNVDEICKERYSSNYNDYDY